MTTRAIHQLASDQEETDTRIVLYLKYAVQLGYKSAVVRTPDSDIFFILLHHAPSMPLTIYLDTGTGKHRQIINITDFAEAKGSGLLHHNARTVRVHWRGCHQCIQGKGEDRTPEEVTEQPQVPHILQVRVVLMNNKGNMMN